MSRPVAPQMARSSAMVLVLLMTVASAWALQVVSTRAGIIQYVEGDAFLEGNWLRFPRLPIGSYHQMENGQELRTLNGRTELLLNSYVYLRLGEQSLLWMEQNRPQDIQLALKQGSALLEVVEELPGNQIRLHCSTSVIEIRKAGLYRLDAGSGDLKVYGGTARVTNGNRQITVRAGRMVHLNGNFVPSRFDAKTADPLHQWAAQRSFHLFIADSSSRQQPHWKPISLGWLHSSSYRMRFRSLPAFIELLKDQQYQTALQRMQATQAAVRAYAQAMQELVAARVAAQSASAAQPNQQPPK